MAVGGSSRSDFKVASTQVVGVGTVNYTPEIKHSISWTNGTGASAINAMATMSHTLTGGTDEIDLNADFVDLTGDAVVFTGAKDFMVFAPASNTGAVTVNFGGTNGWDAGITGSIILKPNSSARLMTGNATAYAITAGTVDLIEVTGTAADVLQIGVGGVVAS